jgi:choline dehydrogenase-like flavoprotein
VSKNNYDVIIVGLGASGAASAWMLSKSNFKILIIEQGKEFEAKDYHKKNQNWEISKLKKFNLNPNLRDEICDYKINNSNSDIDIANFNAVGGSTILYSGHFLRFHPSDFKVRTLDKIASDWPLNYHDLKPYYELNEKIIGIHGLEGDPAYPEIKNLEKNIQLGRHGEKIALAFKKLNWHCWPSYSAIDTKNDESVKTVCQTYLPLIKKKKNITIKKNLEVFKILTNQNKATGVLCFDNKKNCLKYEAKIIILACNGIGTPRLLLNSKNKFFPNGIANNSSGLVGKNLMLHPLGFVEGTFKQNLQSNHGPEGCCVYSHEFYETNKKNDYKRGFTMQVLRGSGPLETAMYLKKIRKLNFGKNFFKDFFDNYNRTIPIAIISEDLPKKSNYIELDYNLKNKNGIPGVKINYKVDNNTKKILKNGIKYAKKVLEVAGAKKIFSFAPVRHTGWHLMGTAKMGKNEKTSVVNENGQCHDIKNLLIVDSSIFVTGAAVNPIATLQALSLKISKNILLNKYDY